MRILQCVAALLVWAMTHSSVLAQATFALRNGDPGSGVNAPVYDWTGARLAGPDWRAELYGGINVGSLTPLWEGDAQRREIVPLDRPGYFHSAAGYLAVSSAPAGGWAWLQLKVWDISLGATYEEAEAQALGGYGQSAVFYAQGGHPGVPTLPGPLIGLTSFSVSQVVPEPAVGWLLLAGLPVWWWRRRKRR